MNIRQTETQRLSIFKIMQIDFGKIFFNVLEGFSCLSFGVPQFLPYSLKPKAEKKMPIVHVVPRVNLSYGILTRAPIGNSPVCLSPRALNNFATLYVFCFVWKILIYCSRLSIPKCFSQQCVSKKRRNTSIQKWFH